MNQPPSTEFAETPRHSDRNLVIWVYALFMSGLLIGIAALVGIILAHIKHSQTDSHLLKAHLNYQIRTFWWGFLWFVVGMTSAIFLIGWFILLVNVVWLLYRCIKGMLALLDEQYPPSYSAD